MVGSKAYSPKQRLLKETQVSKNERIERKEVVKSTIWVVSALLMLLTQQKAATAGSDGHVVLVNGTNVSWKRVYQQSYQMNKWDNQFPETITKGQTVSVPVEWKNSIFDKKGDSGAEVDYELVGTGQRFQIQARAAKGYSIQVALTNISTKSKPKGSVIPLGWNDEGNVNFVLAGTQGNYTGTGLDTANWMRDQQSLIGNRRLMEICLPGSHDSGMSRSTWNTLGSRDGFTLTQTKDIAGQLNLGTRFFDIRPGLRGGKLFCAHGDTKLGGMGATGQSIDDVIRQVNAFTDTHNELVILNISHGMNMDKSGFPNFSSAEWKTVFDTLSIGLKNRVFQPAYADLSRTKLNDLLKGNQEVIILCAENSYTLPVALQWNGFFSTKDNFAILDRYADKKNWREMYDDQRDKLATNGADYFLLSWTLTQQWNVGSAILNVIALTKSIMGLASEANNELTVQVYSMVDANKFPNILYIDDVSNDQSAALATAINWKRTINSYPDKRGTPITDLYVMYGQGKAPEGYQKIPVDLNKGAKGDWVYLCYTRDKSKGAPITQVFVSPPTQDPNYKVPSGFTSVPNSANEKLTDLNRGTGGGKMYFSFQRDGGANQIRAMRVIEGQAPLNAGWVKLVYNLNAATNTKGAELYLSVLY
jgi:hypothetical protein